MADVPLESWVISFKEKLEEAKQFTAEKPWEKRSIYQVPPRLRDVQENNEAYVPKTISIGPHHLKSEQVQDTVIYKRIALNQILERTGQDLNIYLNSIKEIEQQARDCYQQKFEHLSSNDFVEMMVLDGCFISELLRVERYTPVFSNERMVEDILLDMVMLENQIPLVVIQTLFTLIYGRGNRGEPNELATHSLPSFFNHKWLTGKTITDKELHCLKSALQPDECLHVLDVFRRSLIYGWPGPPLDTHGRPRGVIIHSVTDLREGGVKFNRRDSNCFGDIFFNNDNGVFEIPTIKIHDSTRTILLNVAAFEHCHLKISDAKIASYVVFMQCLIKSPEDVGHLHRRGIIENILGDYADVVDMFKSIPKEILVDTRDGYYAEVSEKVNAYYSRRRNRWRASLFQKYLNSPWTIISLIAAFILLVLTTIQSFYAVYAYYRPNS